MTAAENLKCLGDRSPFTWTKRDRTVASANDRRGDRFG
jgi:hypothetical protein